MSNHYAAPSHQGAQPPRVPPQSKWIFSDRLPIESTRLGPSPKTFGESSSQQKITGPFTIQGRALVPAQRPAHFQAVQKPLSAGEHLLSMRRFVKCHISVSMAPLQLPNHHTVDPRELRDFVQ